MKIIDTQQTIEIDFKNFKPGVHIVHDPLVICESANDGDNVKITSVIHGFATNYEITEVYFSLRMKFETVLASKPTIEYLYSLLKSNEDKFNSEALKSQKRFSLLPLERMVETLQRCVGN